MYIYIEDKAKLEELISGKTSKQIISPAAKNKNDKSGGDGISPNKSMAG